MVTEVGSERTSLDRAPGSAPERPSSARRPSAPHRARAADGPAPWAERSTTASRRPPTGGGSERVVGLDALRALAVLLVVAYHVAPAALPGGFVGVDVFFVVSGFLITTLLLRELSGTRRIRLREFWRRRARRLLPALAVVVVVSVLAARVVAPDLLVGVGRQVLGAATFSTNWLEVAAGQSYFDATQPVLFQTFWSLAVEEQFYLVWPLLLVLLIVLTPTTRSRVRVVAVGAAASAVAMAVLLDPGDPTRVYYGTDTHAFGLLLGAAAALHRGTGARLLPGRSARWAVPAGLAGLGVLTLTAHTDTAWPYRGGILAASLLALLLVARCADATTDALIAGRRGPGARLAESAPVVWVGTRSYGLYLWHWPVLLLVDAVVAAQPGTVPWWRGTVVALGVTVLAAAASYRWVETPIRRDGFRGTAARVRTAVATTGRRVTRARVLAGAAGLAVVVTGAVVVTAPGTSQAQLAIEQGQAMIVRASVQDPTREAARPAEKVTGDRISAFGDSVLSGAAPALFEKFPGIAIDGEPIRKWVDAPAIVRAAERRGELRDVVVLQFGTNGGFAWDGAVDAFEEVLDVVGPDRDVVVFAVVGVSDWVPGTNRTLDEIAARHDNVHVAPWDDVVRDRPGLLHADRTHPDVDGTSAYARLLRKTLAQID
ncbi:acyltransferase family protein [Isoptericola dokdonensis]|uniref:O-acetyltransferase OatA n=1 Tax=Isoptericola dokdonensis DS-3 TaxID=1300344 RepID=A0A161ICT1_9MICO|nr:acyltransferase family protein [Isoptericola dokdonensis]ANC31071.1 O-acetyltransferase OatA [Isoptericola dokdonensis DS-3]